MCAQSVVRSENRKVLFVFDSKFSGWKGTQKFFYEFGNYLKTKGYEITLVENNRNSDASLLPKGLELPFNTISFKFGKIFSAFSISRKILDDISPAIIYANSFNTLPILPRYNYKVIFGLHVIHISSLKYMNTTERLRFNIKKVIFIAIVKFIWRNKDIMIHALNTDQRDWVEKITNKRFPVRVIGNPVDCRIDESIAFLKHLEKNKRLTVLYFGSFSREKGFSGFLKILENAEQYLQEEISFIIAGDGVMKDQAISLSMKYDNIQFIEKPSDDQKMKIMLSSDLFVFPSINENFPVTAVEAQSSGLPCLFSDITPLKNIVIEGKSGFCLSLDGNFEKRFFDKIQDYLRLWQNDYGQYLKMRVQIAESTRRLCKENVLPQLLDMVEALVNK